MRIKVGVSVTINFLVSILIYIYMQTVVSLTKFTASLTQTIFNQSLLLVSHTGDVYLHVLSVRELTDPKLSLFWISLKSVHMHHIQVC